MPPISIKPGFNNQSYTNLISSNSKTKNLSLLMSSMPFIDERLDNNQEVKKQMLKANNFYNAFWVNEFERQLYRDSNNYEKFGFKINIEIDPNLLPTLHAIQDGIRDAQFHNGCYYTKTFSPEKELIVGYGNASVFDNGLSLHPQYGFPIIPASGWQGAVRSWIIKHYFNNDEKEALSDLGFLQMFGNTDAAGDVIFYDALPIEFTKANIGLNMGNPHYGSYYTSKGLNPPKDLLSLSPFFYLTVVGPIQFKFHCGVTELKHRLIPTLTKKDVENKLTSKFANKTPLGIIMAELPNIFKYAGVGAGKKRNKGKLNEVNEVE